MRAALLTLSLFFATSALAAPPAEVRSDHQQLADDRHDLRDDPRDFHAIESIVDRWHDARARGDKAAERAADDALFAWVKREIEESRHEVHEDAAELAGSRREAHRSNARRGSTPRTGRAAHRANDDARDRADDRQDLNQSKRDYARMKVIAAELRELQPHFAAGTAGPPAAQRKSALLRELQAMSAAELREDHEERVEDRRELREDR